MEKKIKENEGLDSILFKATVKHLDKGHLVSCLLGDKTLCKDVSDDMPQADFLKRLIGKALKRL